MQVEVHALDYIVITLYFAGILFCGIWFGRHTRTTNDFFFGGQRFSWWLVAISCVATLVGSYSFIQYAETGFTSGISSTICYTNDWFIIPLFMLAWLPIIYFSRVQSIPEYFERRFDSQTRMAALFVILLYLIGYIGINLLTIGTAVKGILNLESIYPGVLVVAVISAVYMHGGGQTSVIMTDLFQGGLLLLAGFIVFFSGVSYLGGWGNFWEGLPLEHRLPFAGFNHPPAYHTVGLFWSDGITGTIAFYCMNQGILMRFMSAKSVRDGKKAIAAVVLIFMPIAAVAVSNAGWVGKAMVSQGIITSEVDPRDIFVQVASMVCAPGVFGLVMAALVAALMSTLDTLINAASAVAINDIWRSKVVPNREDSYYLHMARYFAIAATVLGILLVPVFDSFTSIFQAFSAFTALVTPPMIVVIALGVLWRGFTAKAAFLTLILGTGINFLSLLYPEMISLVAHGVDPSGGYSYMRAFFGVLVSTVLGVAISLFTPSPARHEVPGVTIDTLVEGKRIFKGGEPSDEGVGIKITAELEVADIPDIQLSQQDMERLCAKEGDILYVSDIRPWLGGLRSAHVKAGKPHNTASLVKLSKEIVENSSILPHHWVSVEKIM